MNKIAALGIALLFVATAAPAEDLVRNGAGLRTKPILGAMYELELLVPADLKGAAAQTLIEADRPMELRLTIKSSLITRRRFVETTTDGFARAAESGYASDQTQAFLDSFAATDFKKGDVVVMRYAAGELATLYRQKADGAATRMGSVPGLGLKQALFAIWLGARPAQESLKQALLGSP